MDVLTDGQNSAVAIETVFEIDHIGEYLTEFGPPGPVFVIFTVLFLVLLGMYVFLFQLMKTFNP